VLRVRGLTRRFGRPGRVTVAVDDVSFDVGAAEIVALVGPAASGKSTLLRTIAGQEAPDAGTVEIHVPFRGFLPIVRGEGELVADLSVGEHVTRWLGADADGPASRLLLDRLGLAGLTDRRPFELAVGPRHRLVLARALIACPDLVLLDDPLAGLAARARADVRREMVDVQRRLGFAAVLVTRDGAEVSPLAHRLAVMAGGSVAQIGSRREVYEEPASRYVATYLGTANELAGRVEAIDGDGGEVVVGTPLGEVTGRSGVDGLAVGDAVVALWRPERTRLGPLRPAGPNRWPVTVEATLFLGPHTQRAASAAGHRFLVWEADGPRLAGNRAWVGVDPADVRVLPADATA
jgi:iron(III) transport system ATP-binding protein